MKRSWIGFSLLVVLLVISLVVTLFMTRIHESVELDLKQSGQCALDGDWDNAELFFRRARRSWDKWEHFRACFADHTPTEEIDAAFAALEVYRLTREQIAFPAGCASLARQIAAVGEAHRLVWWNLL